MMDSDTFTVEIEDICVAKIMNSAEYYHLKLPEIRIAANCNAEITEASLFIKFSGPREKDSFSVTERFTKGTDALVISLNLLEKADRKVAEVLGLV